MSSVSLKGHPVLQTPGLKQVFAAIEAAGGEARMVGGAVRNALLGEPVHEVDIATTLAPEATMRSAQAAGLKAHPTGIDHGTVTIVSGNNAFEVTTLRHDVETHGRHATVAFTDDWQADAARRDFTMNALYASLDGEIFDPLGGIGDALCRNVRFAGDAETRIREDFLRVLRFFRFHAQYGDGALDEAGLAACTRLKDGLNKLSRERVGQEMKKLLLAKGAAQAAGLMNGAGVSQVLFGRDLDDAVLERLAAIDAANALSPDYPLRLAGCLAMSADELGESLRLSNAEVRAIAALREAMPPSPALRENERKVVLYHTGAETFTRAARLAWAHSNAPAGDAAWLGRLTLLEEWPLPALPVTGSDLIAAGLEPGPELGATLRRLEDWWVAGGFVATREELLAKVSA
jgi:poly(A) polymerase